MNHIYIYVYWIVTKHDFPKVVVFDDFREATLQTSLDPACIRQPPDVNNYFTWGNGLESGLLYK